MINTLSQLRQKIQPSIPTFPLPKETRNREKKKRRRKKPPDNTSSERETTTMPRLSLIPLLLATATAHFTINTPPARSPSSEAGLAKGPCGGAALDFGSDGSVSDFHVGGDAVAVTGTHPESNWLIRATNDTKGQDNWVRLIPIVKQSGLGKMCQPDVTVPEDWVGSEGLIGVVAHAEDGILFAVSFSPFFPIT